MIIAIAAVGPNKELVRTIDKVYSDFEHEAIFEAEVGDNRIFIGYNAWTNIADKEKVKVNGHVTILVEPDREVPVELSREKEANPEMSIMTINSFLLFLETGVLGKKEDVYILGGSRIFRATYPYWDKLFLAIYKTPQVSSRSFPYDKVIEDFLLVYEKSYTNFTFRDYIAYNWLYGQELK